jgi:flagellar hook-associated protein 2
MIISGDQELLKSIGLVTGMKAGDKEGAGLAFDQRYFTSYMGTGAAEPQNGSLDVSKDGKKITLKGLLWQEYVLPVKSPIQKETVLSFSAAHSKEKKPEEEQLPYKLETGPEEKIVVKGIELKGYNVSRIRPLEEKKPEPVFDSLLGVGIVSADAAGKRVEKIYPVNRDAKGNQEIPVGRDFAGMEAVKIIFYCNDGTGEFQDAAILTPEKEKDRLEPKHVIAKVDGIEITREKNSDLKDVIKGLSIDLKSPSKRPVTVKVEQDLEKSMGKIRQFVEAYNKYLDLHRELTKVERGNKPGDYEKNRDKNGLFVGDMTIVRLENMMKSTINGAYPSRAETPIKIFTQMGVSTGKINSDWQAIKDGKLVIDDELLKRSIEENPEGVRMFFGSDTDGDNKEDSGMAFTLNNQLNAYIGFGKNIINSRMDLEDENIKLASERIERQEDHLKKYEDKLRKKFASMEQAISGAKAQRTWMNQQMGTGDDKK